jgi:hypothetical protein
MRILRIRFWIQIPNTAIKEESCGGPVGPVGGPVSTEAVGEKGADVGHEERNAALLPALRLYRGTCKLSWKT